MSDAITEMEIDAFAIGDVVRYQKSCWQLGLNMSIGTIVKIMAAGGIVIVNPGYRSMFYESIEKVSEVEAMLIDLKND